MDLLSTKHAPALRTSAFHIQRPFRSFSNPYVRPACGRTTTCRQVHTDVTESWPEASENQGRSATELRADERLHRLERFHTLQWPEHHLRDGHEWWAVWADTQR